MFRLKKMVDMHNETEQKNPGVIKILDRFYMMLYNKILRSFVTVGFLLQKKVSPAGSLRQEKNSISVLA